MPVSAIQFFFTKNGERGARPSNCHCDRLYINYAGVPCVFAGVRRRKNKTRTWGSVFPMILLALTNPLQERAIETTRYFQVQPNARFRFGPSPICSIYALPLITRCFPPHPCPSGPNTRSTNGILFGYDLFFKVTNTGTQRLAFLNGCAAQLERGRHADGGQVHILSGT